MAKRHTGLVYNSRENSFPDCKWIHSVGLGLATLPLRFMMIKLDVVVVLCVRR